MNWLFFTSLAHGFCGTYVGGPDDELLSGASQVILARSGDITTLTLANDYAGDVDDFGLLVPVPSGMSDADVQVADPDLFPALEAYSSPRLVSYACEDLFQASRSSGAFWGCTEYEVSAAKSSDQGAAADGSVEVEARFVEGEYEMVLLSADDGSALNAWLEAQGFVAAPGGDALLQDYIDGGSWFLAARVLLAEVPDDDVQLSPIQLTYASKAVSIPVRLGTLNSPGEQDLILYTLSTEGNAGISNYPEVEVETDCMLPEGQTIDSYLDMLDAALDGQAGGWVKEYGWVSQKCDPCVTDPLDTGLVYQTGLGQSDWYETPFFTRIRMRFSPEDVTEDLNVYFSGDTTTHQQRYITHKTELEAYFPVCGEGWLDDPGSCPEDTAEGCTSSHSRWGMFLLPFALFFVRRRAW